MQLQSIESLSAQSTECDGTGPMEFTTCPMTGEIQRNIAQQMQDAIDAMGDKHAKQQIKVNDNEEREPVLIAVKSIGNESMYDNDHQTTDIVTPTTITLGEDQSTPVVDRIGSI